MRRAAYGNINKLINKYLSKNSRDLSEQELSFFIDNIIYFSATDVPLYPDWSHRLVDSSPAGTYQYEEWKTKYKNDWYRIGVIIDDYENTFMFNSFLQKIGGGDHIIRQSDDDHPYINASYWRENLENILMEEKL